MLQGNAGYVQAGVPFLKGLVVIFVRFLLEGVLQSNHGVHLILQFVGSFNELGCRGIGALFVFDGGKNICHGNKAPFKLFKVAYGNQAVGRLFGLHRGGKAGHAGGGYEEAEQFFHLLSWIVG